MSNYFSKFPVTYYNFANASELSIVTKITSRYSLQEEFKNNAATYYQYIIEDGDTPEIIASKVYDSPERHWIVLAMNDIVDPQYDWPLQYDSLLKYIDLKYSANNYADTSNTNISGAIWAKRNISDYYEVETITTEENYTQKRYIKVDADYYANNVVVSSGTTKTLSDGSTITIDKTKETRSYYDYEIDTNEEKRNIKLLKKQFVGGLESELEKVFK